MLRLAADENLNNDLVRGMLRRGPGIDIVRIQDAGLSGADDPAVLASAVDDTAGAARVIDDLMLLAECSSEHEWEGRILYVPL